MHVLNYQGVELNRGASEDLRGFKDYGSRVFWGLWGSKDLGLCACGMAMCEKTADVFAKEPGNAHTPRAGRFGTPLAKRSGALSLLCFAARLALCLYHGAQWQLEPEQATPPPSRRWRRSNGSKP